MYGVSSWLDSCPALKTFGPSFVTGFVTTLMASMAYLVSRSQREIAANKYNLDLFEKRYPLYEKFCDLFSHMCDEESGEFILEKQQIINDNRNFILKCSRIFQDISDDCHRLIDCPKKLWYADYDKQELEEKHSVNSCFFNNPFSLEQKIIQLRKQIKTHGKKTDFSRLENLQMCHSELKNCISLKENFSDNLQHHKDTEVKIRNKHEEMTEIAGTVNEILKNIYRKMEEQLTISHNPY